MDINEALGRVDEIRSILEDDGLIVFPTDTIYGIGCHARSEKGLLDLRKRKDRWGKPFSIIVPSIEYLRKNFLVRHEEWLDKLPGPYTFVFEAKEPFPKQLSPDKVGVRIPDHPIKDLVAALGFPLVATSVNRSGMDPLSDPAQLGDAEYEAFADLLVIEDGIKDGPASTVVDLSGDRPVYLRM